MTKDQIFEEITIIIKEQLGRHDLVITPETRLQDDLGVDSIALTEFVINLEDSFNVSIPDEDVEQMSNMREMLDYLSNKIAK